MTNSDNINIVSIIENTKLDNIQYSSRFINKIKEEFTSNEQKLFFASFYCYLNYNQDKDFVIKLNDIWEWLGYSRIDNCKKVLISNFNKNTDFVIEKSFPAISGKPNLGGRPSEIIKMTIKCFKLLCIKSNTTKASEIHNYYIKLEDIYHKTIIEDFQELKTEILKLQNINKDLQDSKKNIFIDNSNYLVKTFDGKPVFYIFVIFEENGVIIEIKFGITNDIVRRENEHKSTYGEYGYFKYVIESMRNDEIEKIVKIKFKKYIFERECRGKSRVELMRFDTNFTIEMFHEEVLKIRDYVMSTDKLLEDLELAKNENEILKKEIERLNADNLNNELKFKLIESNFSDDTDKISQKNKISLNESINKYIDKEYIQEQIQEQDKEIIKSDIISINSDIKNTDIKNIKSNDNVLKIDTNIKLIKKQLIRTKRELKDKINENKINIFNKKILSRDDINYNKLSKDNEQLSKDNKPFSSIANAARAVENKLDGESLTCSEHCLKDNYIGKPRQRSSWILWYEGGKYWEPPENFYFIPMFKASTKCVYLKLINKETGIISYFNSIAEAGIILKKLYNID